MHRDKAGRVILVLLTQKNFCRIHMVHNVFMVNIDVYESKWYLESLCFMLSFFFPLLQGSRGLILDRVVYYLMTLVLTISLFFLSLNWLRSVMDVCYSQKLLWNIMREVKKANLKFVYLGKEIYITKSTLELLGKAFMAVDLHVQGWS